MRAAEAHWKALLRVLTTMETCFERLGRGRRRIYARDVEDVVRAVNKLHSVLKEHHE